MSWLSGMIGVMTQTEETTEKVPHPTMRHLLFLFFTRKKTVAVAFNATATVACVQAACMNLSSDENGVPSLRNSSLAKSTGYAAQSFFVS